jgi:hypothetical protein
MAMTIVESTPVTGAVDTHLDTHAAAVGEYLLDSIGPGPVDP